MIGQINDEREIHSLRATLIERSEILLLGSANSFFDAIGGYGEPLYEFFRVFKLEGIGQEEARRILEAVAISEGRTEVSESLNMEHGRLEIIRRLSGGNPRLLALACRLLIESPMGSALEDLERLIDEQTPYFKARTEYLPGQTRKVFHCLSEGWKPLLAKEVAAAANLSSSHASAQLKQLTEKGYTREVRLPDAKRTRYEVSDRFYNIYYLLRYSRSGRGRLERLVEFLHDLFGPIGMARGGNRTEALSSFEQALSVRRGQFRERERPRLAQSMIRTIAAGHAGRVKHMMEEAGLVESMEPLWHAVRAELGEDLEALPAEILDAVSVIRETVADATMATRP